MSRFVSDATTKIELGDKEWIEVRKNLSFTELEPIIEKLDQKNEAANIKMAIPLLETAIVNWYLYNEKKEVVEFNKEKIKQLDSETVLEMVSKMTELYYQEKKKSNNLEK